MDQDAERALEHRVMEQKTLIYVMGAGLVFMTFLLILSFYMIAKLINEGTCHYFNVIGI